MNGIAVFLVSAAPATAFLLYILWMDRREPEPLGFILRTLILGALSCLPAVIAEGALDFLPLFHRGGIQGALLVSFLQVAPVEEACKLLVVVLFLWNHPNFDEENDGIVYAGTAALGFAFLENLFYVAQEGLGIGVLRAFTSVPLHVSTGIVMGYHAGLARFTADAEAGKRRVWKGFAIAWFMHGAYDSLALCGSAVSLLVFPLAAAVSSLGFFYAYRGRRLSLARWGAAPIRPERPPPPGRKPSRVPIVFSRTLFALVLLFWALLNAGLMTPESEGGQKEAVLGGVVLTFLPVLLGVFLEIAYARSRKRASGARTRSG